MKWLLIPTAFLLIVVAGVGYRAQDCYRKIDRLQATVDSLEQVVFVRQWVDRRNFARLISNVQWHNLNAVTRYPQIKKELDLYNEWWQLWLDE